jgi:ribosomal 50S subunit-associated protein YjgA (DUF615 family)
VGKSTFISTLLRQSLVSEDEFRKTVQQAVKGIDAEDGILNYLEQTRSKVLPDQARAINEAMTMLTSRLYEAALATEEDM